MSAETPAPTDHETGAGPLQVAEFPSLFVPRLQFLLQQLKLHHHIGTCTISRTSAAPMTVWRSAK